jgi:hypothetical protein
MTNIDWLDTSLRWNDEIWIATGKALAMTATKLSGFRPMLE